MRIGYACLGVGIPGSDFKTCTIKNASEERLAEITTHNLDSLERLIKYNISMKIHLFRISSDLIPFASSPVNSLKWQEMFSEKFQKIGDLIKQNQIRVSMHPGQYTVLNSKSSEVVTRAVEELRYHKDVLNALKVDAENKIVLHIGGIYGDKKSAQKRFLENYRGLEEDIRESLVIENDDRSYTIEEVLEIGTKGNIPVVYDNLHHKVNSSLFKEDDLFWIQECKKTWKEKDGTQKIHYSQQNEKKQKGAHSETIKTSDFMKFLEKINYIETDIMLEVKDKNLSAVKCLNLTSKDKKILHLEKEWGKYKYTVLERAPGIYLEIRKLLKDKSDYPVQKFYAYIEEALKKEGTIGQRINGLEHVWGYFNNKAGEDERKVFFTKLNKYEKGETSITSIKKFLWKMTEKYDDQYLKQSLYFWIN